MIVHSTWRGATLAPRPTTTENGATTMNDTTATPCRIALCDLGDHLHTTADHHTCEQGPGHPILATNRGTCPACPSEAYIAHLGPSPTHDETDRGILDLAERIANDLAQSGMDGDTDTVTLFLEQAIQVARATLSGSLDTVTQQIVLNRVEAATEAMADLLDDLAVGTDGPR